MALREHPDESGLLPGASGVAGVLDIARRDRLLARMPANKVETRIQGALLERLYPLPQMGNVAISFTYPSKVFLVETNSRCEITFELDKALEYVPSGDRLTSRINLRPGVYGIRNGKRAPHFD
jgi:hypothetical protein